MADDVRVKLSAEGVQEVVDAMKRIREESEKTAHEAGSAFEQLGEKFDKVTEYFLSYLAIEKILDGFKDLFHELYTSAIQMGNLSRETGFAVGSIQALDKMAEAASVNADSLNKGLEKFSQNVGLASQGSRGGAAGFNALGISMKGFVQLKPEEQLQVVAEKLGAMKNASDQAAIGVQIFGRGFADIQPVLSEVADGGLQKMQDHLKTLGLLMNDDIVQQMKDAHVAMADLGDEVQGLGQQFLLGLLPAATQAMDGVVKSIDGGGVNGMRKLGEWVGWAIKQIVAAFQFAGATIGYVAARIEFAINHAKDALKDLGVGAANVLKNSIPFGSLVPDLKNGKRSEDYTSGINAMRDEFGRQLKAIEDAREATPESAKAIAAGRGNAKPVFGVGDQAAANARLQLIKAQLAAELKIYEASAKLKEDEEKRDYEAGKLSLQQYYADRETITRGRYDRELDSLKAQRAAIAALPTTPNDNGASALQKRAQLAAIDGDIAAKKLEQQAALASLAAEERQAQEKFYSDSLKAEEALYKLQGDKAAAAKLELADELRALDVQLQRGGIAQAEREAALKATADKGLAKINYDDVKTDADATLQALNTQIAAIQSKVKDGTLFPIQAEQQIIELEKQRLPVLQQMATEMEGLAKATGDATLQSQADQFAQKVREIGVATNEAGQQMAALKQTAQDALQNGLATFLTDATSGTMTLAQAFDKMVFSIASSLAKLEAEFLAKQFVKWLAGESSGSGAAAANAKGAATQGILGRIGGFIGGLFGGGGGGGAGNAAASATTTANTTAVSANTAAQSVLSTAMTALTAAVTANTAAVGAGAASSAGSGIVSAIGSAAGSAASSGGYADGGHVRGAGTGTSDSIPAMLSDGEFVVNAGSVSKPGVLALLHAINGTPGYARGSAPGVRRYAEGGVVAGGGMTVNHYHVDASEVPAHIVQQAVDNAIAASIARQPVKIRSSLG